MSGEEVVSTVVEFDKMEFVLDEVMLELDDVGPELDCET